MFLINVQMRRSLHFPPNLTLSTPCNHQGGFLKVSTKHALAFIHVIKHSREFLCFLILSYIWEYLLGVSK